jgi:hypothetical protein
MPQNSDRRTFLSGLVCLSLSPLAAGKIPQGKISNRDSKQTLNKITPLNREYVSVNGWVVAKVTLTKGTH